MIPSIVKHAAFAVVLTSSAIGIWWVVEKLLAKHHLDERCRKAGL